MKKTLSAGWSSKCITPEGRRVSLRGQYYERITNEKDSDILATALAMGNGETEFTWVSCDLVGISAVLCNDAKYLVREKAPLINTDNIFLSAIHTHNAPYIKASKLPDADPRFRPGENIMSIEEYHEFAVGKIAEAILEANMKKNDRMTLQTGVAPVKTGCCRRGIIDTGEAVMYINTKRPDFVRMEASDGGPIYLMYLKDENSRTTGVIACIPCPSQVLEHQYYISSDFTGRIRTLLQQKYGSDFLFLPLIGSAGDQSPRNLVTKDYGFGNMYDKDGADNMAVRIFDAIVREENHPVEIIDNFTDMKVSTASFSLPGWIPTDEEYEWAVSMKDSDEIKYDIKDYVQKDVEPYFRTPLALANKVKTIIIRYENKEFYESVETDIAAVRLGNTVWVSNPFELFQEYGTRMIAGAKAESLWSIQLTQNTLGYFPTDYAARAGGYGAFISSSRVDPYRAGDMLVEESIKLADLLFV